jgi:thiol:disulfide interchange protein
MRILGRWSAAVLLAVLAGCEVSVENQPQAEAPGAVPAAAAPQREVIHTAVPAGANLRELPVVEEAAPLAPAAETKNDRVAHGNLHFIEGYQQGYKHALENGKPMLVFFTAEWCQYCHQMANEAFVHQQVVSLSERFVCILVDADKEPEVCRNFRVQGYPTIQFLSPRGVPLNRIVGKKPGHQVTMAMQAALQNVARNPANATTGTVVK